MRLNKLFFATTALLLTLVSILFARAVVGDWHTVQRAQSGLEAMELSYRAMKVAEKASAERGPTIPVLNDTVPADPLKRERLASARRASDLAFEDALQGLTAATTSTRRDALNALQRAQEQLRNARIEVDRVAALPYEVRTEVGSGIRREPIDQMFAVIDTTLDGVTSLTSEALRTYPELSQPLEGARLGAILREYAGRLGSQFTTPLATQMRLPDRERNDIHHLVGRIEQLRQLIEMQAQANAGNPRVATALAEMKSRYFAIGMPFIASLTAAGTEGRPYGMDTAQFVARYVPEMTSIVTMRDAMFLVAREEATTRVAEAKRHLRTSALIGLAVLLTEISVLLLIRRRVLKPLLANTRLIVDIADGKHDAVLPTSTRRDEVGDLERAVVTLATTSQKKRSLELEREELITQLKVASTTDYLTKLLNRRGFIDRAGAEISRASETGAPIAMLLIDLDHFKSVNDLHGHATGDQVLIDIAEIGRRVLREEDLFARYGGEEFIVLASHCNQLEAEQLASRLRHAVESHSFTSASARFGVTISLGVVSAAQSPLPTLEGLVAQADAALYRAKTEGRNRSVQLAYSASK